MTISQFGIEIGYSVAPVIHELVGAIDNDAMKLAHCLGYQFYINFEEKLDPDHILVKDGIELVSYLFSRKSLDLSSGASILETNLQISETEREFQMPMQVSFLTNVQNRYLLDGSSIVDDNDLLKYFRIKFPEELLTLRRGYYPVSIDGELEECIILESFGNDFLLVRSIDQRPSKPGALFYYETSKVIYN